MGAGWGLLTQVTGSRDRYVVELDRTESDSHRSRDRSRLVRHYSRRAVDTDIATIVSFTVVTTEHALTNIALYMLIRSTRWDGTTSTMLSSLASRKAR